jgi:hypothetical protein
VLHFEAITVCETVHLRKAQANLCCVSSPQSERAPYEKGGAALNQQREASAAREKSAKKQTQAKPLKYNLQCMGHHQ